MIIDRKFKIMAVNPHKEPRVTYTEMDGFFFKASDMFAPAALAAYIRAMQVAKADGYKIGDEQIKSAELLLERVRHVHNVMGRTIPDVDEGSEAEVCLAPNVLDQPSDKPQW